MGVARAQRAACLGSHCRPWGGFGSHGWLPRPYPPGSARGLQGEDVQVITSDGNRVEGVETCPKRRSESTSTRSATISAGGGSRTHMGRSPGGFKSEEPATESGTVRQETARLCHIPDVPTHRGVTPIHTDSRGLRQKRGRNTAERIRDPADPALAVRHHFGTRAFSSSKKFCRGNYMPPMPPPPGI